MSIQDLFRRKSVSSILSDLNNNDDSHERSLRRDLGVLDLTAFGIAAIVGAGIFSTIGNVAFNGG